MIPRAWLIASFCLYLVHVCVHSSSVWLYIMYLFLHEIANSSLIMCDFANVISLIHSVLHNYIIMMYTWCVHDVRARVQYMYWCSVQMLLHNPALVECARSRCCGDQVTYTFMAMAITYFGYRVCRWLLGHLYHDYDLHDFSSSRLQPPPHLQNRIFDFLLSFSFIDECKPFSLPFVQHYIFEILTTCAVTYMHVHTGRKC